MEPHPIMEIEQAECRIDARRRVYIVAVIGKRRNIVELRAKRAAGDQVPEVIIKFVKEFMLVRGRTWIIGFLWRKKDVLSSRRLNQLPQKVDYAHEALLLIANRYVR